MRPDVALATGTALSPILADFRSIGQRPLRTVWHVQEENILIRIIFDFDELSLIVSADANDDSVDLEFGNQKDADKTGYIDASQLLPWKDFVGLPFGWGWITVNQQGYCDGLLLSFGNIIPQVILNAVASSLKVGEITKPSIGSAF
jgi:hypothetical protein